MRGRYLSTKKKKLSSNLFASLIICKIEWVLPLWDRVVSAASSPTCSHLVCFRQQSCTQRLPSCPLLYPFHIFFWISNSWPVLFITRRSCIHSGVLSLIITQWSTTDIEVKVLTNETQELSKIFSFKPRVRENIAFHLLPELLPSARTFACLISVFPVHSTSFSPALFQIKMICHGHQIGLFFMIWLVLFHPDTNLEGWLSI